MTTTNQATSLLEKLNALTSNEVTVSVAGVDFTFVRDNSAYDAMINEINTDNKVTPMKDYLLAIVKREQREDLLQIINVPGLAINLAGMVNKALIPQIELSLKK
ncbi:tail assembly chaperone [Volucribacter psittacicida]|uniref:Tail assembly chaperone n=1 Tax=Volucribacter psittacicida TaxID=203482 RepID=A0A4R1FYA6_9PAST|nr:putative phage tail assembly chaperone [Volucribacter psittacicida]TCJ98832.1 tail assembly chaperone [Volucribacter psittacicida]